MWELIVLAPEQCLFFLFFIFLFIFFLILLYLCTDPLCWTGVSENDIRHTSLAVQYE